MQDDRTRVRRLPERGVFDRETLDAILDAGSFAHVAFLDGEQPFCIPLLHARLGDEVLVHGSTASRAFRVLGRGVPTCLTVTLLDGLVLARTVFEHSANYRSAILLGSFRRIEEPDAKLAALEALVERLVPGRWSEAVLPNAQELKATSVLALPIAACSAKVRTGPPDADNRPDAGAPWTGVVPVVTRFGTPEPEPGSATTASAAVAAQLARNEDRA